MSNTVFIALAEKPSLAELKAMTQKLKEEVDQVYSYLSYVDQLQAVMTDLLRKELKPGMETNFIMKLDKSTFQLRTFTERLTKEMDKYLENVESLNRYDAQVTKSLLKECSKKMPGKIVEPMRLASEVMKRVEMVNLSIDRALVSRNQAKKGLNRIIDQLKKEIGVVSEHCSQH